jgi:hypothetical protein
VSCVYNGEIKIYVFYLREVFLLTLREVFLLTLRLDFLPEYFGDLRFLPSDLAISPCALQLAFWLKPMFFTGVVLQYRAVIRGI